MDFIMGLAHEGDKIYNQNKMLCGKWLCGRMRLDTLGTRVCVLKTQASSVQKENASPECHLNISSSHVNKVKKGTAEINLNIF